MRTNRFGAVVTLTALFGAAFGCNAILGIDEPKLVEDEGTGGRGTGGRGSGGNDEAGGNDGGGDETGAGGAASGGKSGGSGGKASGGSPSTGGRGSGGGQSGGSPGTGGTDAGPSAPYGVPGQVACGTESCRIASGSACCVETASGEPHCATTCDSATQSRFACDGAEDCSGNAAVCCLQTGSTIAQCAATCTTGRVFCGADADCAPGQYCAPGGGNGPLSVVRVCTSAPKADVVWCGLEPCSTANGQGCCFNKVSKTVTCTANCPVDNHVKYTCDEQSDCSPGETCCENRTGLQVLTGSTCRESCPNGQLQCASAGDCGQGQVCCRTAAGSTCVDDCPVIGNQLCGTDADCPGTATCTLNTSNDVSEATGRTTCTPPSP